MTTSYMVDLGAEMLGFGMAITSLLVKGKSSMQSYCKSYRSSYRLVVVDVGPGTRPKWTVVGGAGSLNVHRREGGGRLRHPPLPLLP